jgi:HSP20 family protein
MRKACALTQPARRSLNFAEGNGEHSEGLRRYEGCLSLGECRRFSGDEEKTMSNVVIRKQNGDKPTAAAAEQAWDPWRTMRTLLAWDPFREMAPFAPADASAFALNAAFDVKETKDAYLFKADVPGIHEKDLEVTVTGNRLTITGKREAEKEDKAERYYSYERTYGSFTRSFTLPEGADINALRATLEQGVLTINLPKKPEVQPKKIAVKSEGQAAKS